MFNEPLTIKHARVSFGSVLDLSLNMSKVKDRIKCLNNKFLKTVNFNSLVN